MKIVINRCYGGFSLSKEALTHYCELTGKNNKEIRDWEIARDDPALIATIETLGLETSRGRCAEIVIVEIPDEVKWEIEEYDGKEWVAEVHRTWY